METQQQNNNNPTLGDPFERAVRQVAGDAPATPNGAASKRSGAHGGARPGAGRKPKPATAPVQGPPPPPPYVPTAEDIAATRRFLARMDRALVRVTESPLTEAELDDGAREVAPVMPELIGAMSPRVLALTWVLSAYGPRLWDRMERAWKDRRRAQLAVGPVARATGQRPAAGGIEHPPAPAPARPEEAAPPAGAPFRNGLDADALGAGVVAARS